MPDSAFGRPPRALRGQERSRLSARGLASSLFVPDHPGCSVRTTAGALAENPLGMILTGIAAGFLIGSVMPVTRVENERLQPIAENMRGRLQDVGQEALERGQTVLKDTLDAGKAAAVSSAREQAQQLAGSGNGSST